MLFHNVFKVYIAYIIVLYADSANILMMFTIPSLSNHIMYRPLINALAERDHNIVVVTTEPSPPQDKIWDNVVEVDIRNVSYAVWGRHLTEYSRKVSTSNDKLFFHKVYAQICVDMTKAQLSHPNMKNFLKKDFKFDVAVGSIMLLVNLAIAKKFKVPFVGIHPSDILNTLHNRLGNSFSNTYYPDPFYPHARSLITLEGLEDRYNEYGIYASVTNASTYIDKYIKEHLKIEDSSLSLVENTDLVILTTDPIWSIVRPVRPNTLFVGDTRLRPGRKMESELEDQMSTATEGIVYFSLGSNIKSSNLSKDRLKVIIKALGAIPYKVVWKWESTPRPDLPTNVVTAPWFSQQDVLAHPNVRIFVTHGGLLSIREALYHGVPVVVLPFFGDQNFNAMRVKELGVGMVVDYKTMTSEILYDAIMSVGTNRSFTENINSVSERLFDQPMSAVEKGVWWIEYLIRHRNGVHFQPHRISILEYLMVDIIVVIFSLCVTLILSFYMISKLFLKMIIPPLYKNKAF